MNIFIEISEQFGSQLNAAKQLGVSKSTFSAWALGQKKPSVKNVKKIEQLTGHKREVIRPDIY